MPSTAPMKYYFFPSRYILTLCGLQATHRSTLLAGLLLQNCLLVVSLLARWCVEQRHMSSDVKCAAMRFSKTFPKSVKIIYSTVVISESFQRTDGGSIYPEYGETQICSKACSCRDVGFVSQSIVTVSSFLYSHRLL